MRSKSVSISYNDLNSTAGAEIDTAIIEDGGNYYPEFFSIKNVSGDDLEYIIIQQKDLDDFEATPSSFEFIKVLDNMEASNSIRLENIVKIFIRSVNGSAASDAILDLMVA